MQNLCLKIIKVAANLTMAFTYGFTATSGTIAEKGLFLTINPILLQPNRHLKTSSRAMIFNEGVTRRLRRGDHTEYKR